MKQSIDFRKFAYPLEILLTFEQVARIGAYDVLVVAHFVTLLLYLLQEVHLLILHHICAHILDLPVTDIDA